MDTIDKNAGSVTPATYPLPNQSEISPISNNSENLNPKFTSPTLKISRKPNYFPSLPERNFIVAKIKSNECLSAAYKNSRGSQVELFCENGEPFDQILEGEIKKIDNNPDEIKRFSELGGFDSVSIPEIKFVVAKLNSNKYLSAAHKNLRASQDEFFSENGEPFDQTLEGEIKKIDYNLDEIKRFSELGGLNMKRRREELLKEARKAAPEPGCGLVTYLVEAFEKLSTIEKAEEIELKNGKMGTKWALPGRHENKENESQVSTDSFCPSDLSVTSESLGLDSRTFSPSNHNGRISGGGLKSRRNSSESTANTGGDRGKKIQLKAKPFKLRTEQRGKSKQEHLVNKLQQGMVEEEQQRVPVAQALPWTTEAQCLAKPQAKETPKAIDLVLHSEVRAIERAEFDQQVAEKMSLIEQYKKEKERLEKITEEEEIRRLRKELVPKAQPMPFSNRPFIPKRSLKLPTVPREPKFHLPRHKKINSCIT